MQTFLGADGSLQRAAGTETLECPRCGRVAHLSVVALPAYDWLQANQPPELGVVLACDACRQPVFVRYRVRAYETERIELEPVPQEVERPAERFSLQHLPEPVATPFGEALGCYSHGLLRAFAALCTQTAQAVQQEVGEAGRLRLYEQVSEVQELADIDNATFTLVRRVIFEGDSAPAGLDRRAAAALLETMKDMLTETYVRRARLRQALKLRRFFAEQSTENRPGAQAARRPLRVG